MIEFVLALVASILLIHKAGDLFVDSACRIARTLGVSQAMIALTLIAFATSAPEFFTAILASGLGHVGISYGNVVGSNIINIALILALAAVFGMAQIRRGGVGEGLIMLAVGGALVVMSFNSVIGPIEGLLLLAIFALFLRFILKREAMRRKNLRNFIPKKRGKLPKLFLLFVVGTAGILVGSWLLVFGGAGIAQAALVAAGLTPLEAEAAVGFTIIAIGTSLPELATIVISIRKKLPDISVGTIMGSNIFNTALIIGSAALVGTARGFPLQVDAQALWFSNPMMLLSMVLLVWFMCGQKRLTKRQGAILLAFYVFYLAGLALFYTI